MMKTSGDIAEAESPTAPTVLVVEDESSARQASSRYLSVCGARVVTAGSASEALEKAAQCTPDVVVCDWKLGRERDGAELARELQQRYGSRIVFVTAYPLDRLRHVTRDVTVARYLRKPISLPVLAETVNSLIA